jgi:hypothetical protein
MDLQNIIIDAVQSLTTRHNDFWMLAAITDRGFEEGDRNPHFAESVRSICDAGVAPRICQMLSLGMNGMLAQILKSRCDNCQITTQPSRGRDILIHAADGDGAAIDVKHVYDMTAGRYYPLVAHDREKLLKHREIYSHHQLFQVVFFVQLPRADYTAGRWYGKKDCPPRGNYIVSPTIHAQYRKVADALGSDAVWPEHPPLVQQIHWPPTETEQAAVVHWFISVFVPSSQWTFDPQVYLSDAAVGAAIWTY